MILGKKELKNKVYRPGCFVGMFTTFFARIGLSLNRNIFTLSSISLCVMDLL